MGIYRMYTGEDGESHMEELQPSDPIVETLSKVSGCALQVTEPSEFGELHPRPAAAG